MNAVVFNASNLSSHSVNIRVRQQTVAVLDYGGGNLFSVVLALKSAAPDAQIVVTSEPKIIKNADRIVLPGQGSMRHCMNALESSNLLEVFYEVLKNRPVLGICVGMQMLFESSEEGNTKGLAILAGQVRRCPEFFLNENKERLKVPHMGWNTVSREFSHPVWNGINSQSHFYFVHSYFAPMTAAAIASTNYAGVQFASAINQENLFATQFHPEKSAQVGIQLLRNFCSWQP